MYSSGSPPAKKMGGSVKRKRAKRTTWGSRERAGMSFLIVVAFFAIFGLIILTEVLMIDEKNRGNSIIVRHAGGGRGGDILPDYEGVKDDYNLDDNIFIFRDGKSGSAALNEDLKSLELKMSMGIPVVPDTKDARGYPIPWGQALPTKIERTLPFYPNGFKPTDGSWQVVNGTRFKFFVFSAYYDRRDGKLVRIIGSTKTRNPEKVWCRFWYPYGNNSTKNGFKHWSATVMARVKVIRENWNLKYSACFILCPLRGLASEIPYSVSVVSRLRTPPGNVLLLRNTDSDVDFKNRSITEIPPKIAVCVKPLHFNYDQALHLMEFIELNRILGVNHFTLYNHTIGPHATCVLNHYMNSDLPNFLNNPSITNLNSSSNNNNLSSSSTVNFQFSTTGQRHENQTKNNIKDNSNNINNNNNKSPNLNILEHIEKNNNKVTMNLLPWELRMKSQKEIRTEGLFAALNDCLYRNMYRYSHVALIDLDEFIIPRHNDTLVDLLHWLSLRINNKKTAAYSFQNAFFYLQFQDDELVNIKSGIYPELRSMLITQRKTRRRSKLHPQKQRSKYICKPESVIEAGNHFVWEFTPGKGSLNVPADAAILHHYRVCEFGGDDCIKTPSLVDRTAHKYTKRLLERVGAIYEYLKKPCKLPELNKTTINSTQTTKKILKKDKKLFKKIVNNTVNTQ